MSDRFRIAIQEDMLPGPSLEERFEQAADLGVQGLEFWRRTLPGQGRLDFAAALAALADIGYGGWLAFECGEPGDNAPQARHYLDELPASLAYLRRHGA